MSSFEDLGLSDELVASLAADGLESPTAFQASAIPVLRKGNDLLARASSGSGTMIAYGAALLDRLEGGRRSPSAVVICPSQEQATTLARGLARVAEGTGHTVSALSPLWSVPQLADVLFVPADRIGEVERGDLFALDTVDAVVVHDGDGCLKVARTGSLDTFFEAIPKDAQRVVCGLPFSPALETFAAGHTKKAVNIPPKAKEYVEKTKTRRGVLAVTVVTGSRQEGALSSVASLLQDDVRHVVLYTGTEDRTVDASDFLALHGYVSGSPGDETVPVWLATDELEARAAISACSDPTAVATLSLCVPTGVDSLDRRHGSAGPNRIIALPTELAHLRAASKAAGYTLEFIKDPRPPRISARIDELTKTLSEAANREDIAPYYLAVESLLDEFSGAELAAAALLLLDEAKGKGQPQGDAAPPEAWMRLFITVGERDEITARELLGAVTGESGVPGDRIGRIDVRENHSLVEVRESDASTIISSVNGTTLGGRSVRVDYDRGKDRRPAPRGRGGEGGGGPRGGSDGGRGPRGGPPRGGPRGGPGGGSRGPGGGSRGGPGGGSRGGPGGGSRGPRSGPGGGGPRGPGGPGRGRPPGGRPGGDRPPPRRRDDS